MTRTIIHLDLDAFFCAVEEHKQPQLKGLAFAVGGRPEHRGVVASCSYAARKFGVRSAMPMSRAVQLCPDLQIVSRSMGDYSAESRKVMKLLHDLTPLVEQISIDEAFLDVTGLTGDGETIARDLQHRIQTTLDLPCSLGVASNKLVAKIANNIGKASYKGAGPPNAINVIAPGGEAAFLASLPIRELWGVGPKTAERLHKMDVYTIGDLIQWSERDLIQRFGKLGHDLARRARGEDDRPIETEHETKSISAETTFVEDETNEAELKHTLRQLTEQVGRRARKSELAGKTVSIKLRWSGLHDPDTGKVTLAVPVDRDDDIFRAAEKLLLANWTHRRPVRLIGVGLSGFEAETSTAAVWACGINHPKNPSTHSCRTRSISCVNALVMKPFKRGSDLT